ncbi:MAG: rhodanese-like domain-containing protein [Melioribacteraceae bacterium]
MQNNIKEIDVKTCYSKILDGEAVLIDVREYNEIKGVSYNVSNRIDIPLSSFANNLSLIPKDKKIIIGCRSGIRSYNVVNYLTQNNYNSIFNLKGGILEWAKEQLPIEGDITTAIH